MRTSNRFVHEFLKSFIAYFSKVKVILHNVRRRRIRDNNLIENTKPETGNVAFSFNASVQSKLLTNPLPSTVLDNSEECLEIGLSCNAAILSAD